MVEAVSSTFVFGAFLVVGIILFLSNILSRRIEIIENITDYITSGGRLHWALAAAGICSLMDWGGSMMTAAEGGFTFGIGAAWMYATAGIGVFLIGVYVERLSQLIPYPVSVVDVVKVRFGKTVHIFFAFMVILTVFYVALIQGLAVGFLASGLTAGAVPYWVGVALMCVIAASISIRSGGWSTFIATWFSALITAVVTLVAAFALWQFFGGGEAIIANITSYVEQTGETYFKEWTTWKILVAYGFANMAYWFGMLMIGEAWYLPGFITRPKDRAKAYVHGCLWWMMVPLLIGIAGVAGKAVGMTPDVPSNILPYIMRQLPTYALVCLAFYIIFASSATFAITALSFSSIFTAHLYKPYINPDATPKKTISVGRIALVLWIIFIAIVAGSEPGGLVYVYLLFPVIMVPLGIPFIVSLFSEKINGTAWMICSTISVIVSCYVYLTIGSFEAIGIGLLATVITLVWSWIRPWKFDWNKFKKTKELEHLLREEVVHDG
jgi:SSS family solute:Na+ symporter